MRFVIFFCCAILVGENAADTTVPIESDEPTFEIVDDWNLIPDADGKFQLIRKSELHAPMAERFYNAERDIIFQLFTRKNPTEPQSFRFDDSFAGSNFNVDHPTRFTIHGWLGTPQTGINPGLRASGLAVGNFNYITVDWSYGARILSYFSARNRVEPTARVLARFIDRLVGERLINLSTLTIIGHSLGAHVAGIVGKTVQSGRVPVIVGLDPAGPLFYNHRPEDRLDSGDADYVEVIHTAGSFLGFFDPIGDADFYPNGGRTQPGCGLDVTGLCSHFRPHQYYAESFSTAVEFWANPCNSIKDLGRACSNNGSRARMGGEPQNRDGAKGIYYLTTNPTFPYAQG